MESHDAGTQTALLPLEVVLRAFLLGIFDTRVARETVGVLQKLLRADPRTKQLRHGQMGQIVSEFGTAVVTLK